VFVFQASGFGPGDKDLFLNRDVCFCRLFTIFLERFVMKYARNCVIIFVIFVLFGCASHTAQKKMKGPKKDRHWVTTQDGCLVYSPNPIEGETLAWSGECVDGKVNGAGELTWYQDGEATGRHVAEFQSGEIVGRGEYTHLAPAIPVENLPTFTREELATYNGQNGAPAYVAYNGRVYDISHSFVWAGGVHEMSHDAGDELTESFGRAPHGFENRLALFPVVGLFVEE
jgi:predicted heme/steroid binding protein